MHDCAPRPGYISVKRCLDRVHFLHQTLLVTHWWQVKLSFKCCQGKGRGEVTSLSGNVSGLWDGASLLYKFKNGCLIYAIVIHSGLQSYILCNRNFSLTSIQHPQEHGIFDHCITGFDQYVIQQNYPAILDVTKIFTSFGDHGVRGRQGDQTQVLYAYKKSTT